jgi:hypothetical protein
MSLTLLKAISAVISSLESEIYGMLMNGLLFLVFVSFLFIKIVKDLTQIILIFKT